MKFNDLAKLCNWKNIRFRKPFLKPKTGSISEPRFGGHRTLTNGWVSVRCPPNRGSENEPVFGFSFFEFRASVLFMFVLFSPAPPPRFPRNLSYKIARHTYTRARASIQPCERAKYAEGERLICVYT